MVVPIQRKDAAEDLSELYDEIAEQEALAILLEPRYLAMLKGVHELIVATFPTMEDFRLDDEATRRMLDHAAEEVVRIDNTTKAALKDLLKEGQRLGLSNWEIANGSPKHGFKGIEQLFTETWAGRAQLITRNELAMAQIEASQNRYEATGLVDRVTLRDGTGKAPDAPCISRNGQTVKLSSRPQQLHIACTLVLIPVLKDALPLPVPAVVPERPLRTTPLTPLPKPQLLEPLNITPFDTGDKRVKAVPVKKLVEDWTKGGTGLSQDVKDILNAGSVNLANKRSVRAARVLAEVAGHDVDGKLFRGLTMTDDAIAELTGKKSMMLFPSSFSKSSDIADTIAYEGTRYVGGNLGNNPVVIRLTGGNGWDISDLPGNLYTEQKEVIAAGHYRVVSVETVSRPMRAYNGGYWGTVKDRDLKEKLFDVTEVTLVAP